MKNSVLGGRRVISSKDYSFGSAAIVDMTNNMWAVVTIDNETESILDTRMFCYTPTTESDAWKSCLQFYKQVKNCLMRKDLSELGIVKPA